MTECVLSRWAVMQEVSTSPDDVDGDGRLSEETAVRWFQAVREAYVLECDALRAEIESEHLRLSIGPVRALSRASVRAGAVLVAASVTELRTTSFDMGFRARACGEPGGIVAHGLVSLALVDAASDEPVPVPAAVRSDLIRIEKAAHEYC